MTNSKYNPADTKTRMQALLDAAGDVEHQWKRPLHHPRSPEPLSDEITAVGLNRAETGAFRIQIYNFHVPGLDDQHRELGRQKRRELIDRFKSECEDAPAAPTMADAVTWYLRGYDHWLEHIDWLYSACVLSAETYTNYWVGYTDKRHDKAAYGMVTEDQFIGLIKLAQSTADRDNLHDLLAGAPKPLEGLRDALHFI